jgi:hypothetical protein
MIEHQLEHSVNEKLACRTRMLYATISTRFKEKECFYKRKHHCTISYYIIPPIETTILSSTSFKKVERNTKLYSYYPPSFPCRAKPTLSPRLFRHRPAVKICRSPALLLLFLSLHHPTRRRCRRKRCWTTAWHIFQQQR